MTINLTIINNPIGLLRCTQIPYGIKNNKCYKWVTEKVLRGGIKNIIIYQDDIYLAVKKVRVKIQWCTE